MTVPKPILALSALLGLLAGLSAKPAGGVLPAISPGQEQEAPNFELVGQIESEPGVRLKGFFSQVVLRGAYHPVLLQTVTNLGGAFKFKKVRAGTYVLTASTPRHGTSTRTIEITPSFADSKGRVRTSIQPCRWGYSRIARRGGGNGDGRLRPVAFAKRSRPR